MTILRNIADVSVWPRCLIASRWKLCSEGEIIYIFTTNVSLVLYPQSFYFLIIFLWRSWMRHIYGCTSSFFKAVLRIIGDVSVWPRCLILSRYKLCSEGEILFVFSENVNLVRSPHAFCFWNNFFDLPISRSKPDAEPHALYVDPLVLNAFFSVWNSFSRFDLVFAGGFTVVFRSCNSSR